MTRTNPDSRLNITTLLSLSKKDLFGMIAKDFTVSESSDLCDSAFQRHQLANGATHKVKVFICYARPDQAVALQLYADLVADGFLPWIDVKSLQPGEKWKHSINKAIRESDFFVLCLSGNSVNRRGFLQKEIRTALDILNEMLDDDIYLIPVRLNDCVVPKLISRLQWLNLYESDGYYRLTMAICEGWKKRMAR